MNANLVKIEWLASLKLIASEGSFTAAARAQHLSTMAVSKQIQALEAQLGEPVLKRSSRRVLLTELGRQLLERGEPLLKEQGELQSWLLGRHEEPAGVLKIVSHEKNVIEQTLMPYLPEFMHLYPKIEVELDLDSSLIDPKRVDADIFWGIGEYLGRLNPGLKRRRIKTTDFGIFAAPSYIERYGRPMVPDDLEQHWIISYLHNDPNDALIVNHTLGQGDRMEFKTLKSRFRASAGHLQMAVAGFGLFNDTPETLETQQLLEQGKLIPVLEDYWWRGIELFVYYHQTRQPEPKVSAFMKFLENQDF